MKCYIGLFVGYNIFFAIFYRTRIEGLENVPKNSPLIVCANHISMLDMFLFGPRLPIPFTLWQSRSFKIPLLNVILKGLGHIPSKGDMVICMLRNNPEAA